MVDMSSKGFFAGLFRELIASLDSFIYKLLAGIYNVFFNVATADVLQAQMLKALFGRIQIILGVIILFKLVISFFSGVVNPDSLNDQKKGFGSIIKRVVVVLVMLLMIVPLNIPGVNMDQNVKLTGMASWNRNMNNHGILFGSLYELQKRILNENLIFKLINGKQPAENKEDEYNEQRDAGESFSLDVLKTFIMPNVIEDGASFEDECSGEEGKTECVCWYTNGSSDKDDVKLAMKVYFSENATIDQLLSEDVITAFCRDLSHKAANMEKDGNKVWTNAYYALAYSKLWSTIIGVLFCVLLLSLTVDVAVRLFKLVLLEVISPMAILSYIDPASEKSFKNWTKALTETYLALFIRIAIISFILFIVNNISTSFGLENPKGFVGFVSKILIYFGLIMFAKEAPKFITQSLGIESKEGNGLFSGFGKMLGGAVGVLGGVSTAKTAYKASKLADEINDPNTKHSAKNKAKAIMSGLINGTGATVSTAKTYGKAKDHKWRTTMDKVNSANAYRFQNAAEGASWWDGFKDQLKQDFTGDSNYARLERREKDLQDKIKLAEDKQKRLNKYKDKVENEAKNKGLRTTIFNSKGESIKTNLKDILAAGTRGDATGRYIVGGTNLGNKESVDSIFNYSISHGNDVDGYNFAGTTYKTYQEVESAYQSIINRGDIGGSYYAGGIEFKDAGEFGEYQAKAVDEAVNRINNGTAQFANGNPYSLDPEYETMRSDISSMLGDNANFTVQDIKGEEANIRKDIYEKTNEIASIQPEKARAKGRYRGTDGHPGGK